MNHRQVVQAVGRRLPHVARHTVAEVLEVAGEVWAEALSKPGGMIVLINLGRLSVDVKPGVLGDEKVQRIYFRFRPAGWLKEQVRDETQKE